MALEKNKKAFKKRLDYYVILYYNITIKRKESLHIGEI